MRLIIVAAMILGSIAILLQILILRSFLAIFWGNELLVGIVLIFWMLWTGVGAYAGKKRAPATLEYALTLQMSALLSSFLLLALLAGVRWIVKVAPGEYLGILPLLVVAASGLALPGYALGASFRHLAGIAAADYAQPSATIYVFESLGSVIASLLFTFLLVHWLTPIPLLWVMFFVLLVTLASIRKRPIWLLIVLGLFAATFSLSYKIEAFLTATYWHSLAPGAQLVTHAHSRYGELAILDWNGEKSLYVNSLHQTQLPEQIDTQAFAALVMNQPPLRPRHVLLIGGGMGGLAPELGKYPQTRLTYVEMDDTAFALSIAQSALDQRALWDSPRIEVLHCDGREYLLKHPHIRYDAIIVMAGRPTGAAVNRYYTEEFFILARERLNEQGFLALGHIPAGENYLGEELLQLNQSLYGGLNNQFRIVRAVPGSHALFLASQSGLITLNPDTLANSYISQKVVDKHFSHLLFAHLLQEERISYFEHLLKNSAARRNLDFQPIVYYMELMIWQKMMHGTFALGKKIATVKYEWLISLWVTGLALLLILWWKMPALTDRDRGVLLFTAAAVGFVSMSFDVMGIMALQTIFGAVYEQIGLALAAFMLGLASGAWLSMHWKQPTNLRKLILLLAAIAVYASTLEPFLIWVSATMNRLPFFLWMICGGALTGAVFPVICELHDSRALTFHPGIIYAADMAGGACGALCLASFCIPLYGFSQTAWLMVTLTVAALVAVVIIQRPK